MLHSERRNPLLTAAGVGALAGMRALAAPTRVASAQNYKGKGIFLGLAALEMLGDKLPTAPNRISPLLLSTRIASGAISAAYAPSKPYKASKGMLAIVGGVSAAAFTFAAYYARKRLVERSRVKDAFAGMAEDALVMVAGRALFREGSF